MPGITFVEMLWVTHQICWTGYLCLLPYTMACTSKNSLVLHFHYISHLRHCSLLTKTEQEPMAASTATYGAWAAELQPILTVVYSKNVLGLLCFLLLDKMIFLIVLFSKLMFSELLSYELNMVQLKSSVAIRRPADNRFQMSISCPVQFR